MITCIFPGEHTAFVDRYSHVVPIATPLPAAAGVRGQGAVIGLGSPASIAGSESTVMVAVTVAVLVASGLFVLWLRSPGDGATTAPTESAEPTEEAASPEHLDDHEVVREILSARGGRTRQSIIVEETNWSKAKVSAVLAEMDEEGAVSKLRVGRENIVSLPGHEPDAVDSAIEE